MNSSVLAAFSAAVCGLLALLTCVSAHSQTSDLLTVRALNARLLAESEQTALREDEPIEVAAVAELICEVHAERPRCGSYCTSERRDRRELPDYSQTVVEASDCWDTARVLVYGAGDYSIPLDVVLATAYQESRFRRFALGNGSECGLFQQTTHRIRWSSDEVDNMGRAAFVGSFEICEYLLQSENAMWHFALKYRHEYAQNGENWAAYYNGGANMWGYQQRHEGYRERFGAFLQEYRDANDREDLMEAGN